MAEIKRPHPNEGDPQRDRGEDNPRRPEPDTLEGPGGRQEGRSEQEDLDKTTRRGES